MEAVTANQICPWCHEILVLKPISKFRISKGVKALKSSEHVYMCPQCDYYE